MYSLYSLNSSAFRNPNLTKEISSEFGSQFVVVAVDTKFENNDWFVYLDGSRTATGLRTREWAMKVADLGAWEILLTSMNNDGTKDGFALDITAIVSSMVNIPVIASGGTGKPGIF